MGKAFKIRWATGDQVRLPDVRGEWQLRFRDSAAHNFANTQQFDREKKWRLSPEQWLGISIPDGEKLWSFIDENASISDVLKNLVAAGIPKDEIDSPESWHGTEEQQAMLKSKNYEMAKDRNGDLYYIHGWLPIIWLFTDGTWKCEKGSAFSTLEEHLKDITNC